MRTRRSPRNQEILWRALGGVKVVPRPVDKRKRTKPAPAVADVPATQFEGGERVICNGYAGAVVRMYSAGMVGVQLKSGLVCVRAGWPDCYRPGDDPYAAWEKKGGA